MLFSRNKFFYYQKGGRRILMKFKDYLKERKSKCENMYREGKTYKEIARHLGISAPTVHRTLSGKLRSIR